MFPIIKNAPPPVPKQTGRASVYKFDAMEINDAFDAPRDCGKTKDGSDARQNRISNCAGQWAKRKNPSAKFTTRLLDENTVRCHRIA